MNNDNLARKLELMISEREIKKMSICDLQKYLPRCDDNTAEVIIQEMAYRCSPESRRSTFYDL